MSLKKIWTQNQNEAINSKGKFTVVSAAAGSGKTAVIVERVIKLISGKDAIDIDKILIVTFTIASANELKERILLRLKEEIFNNPYNKRLKHQEFLFNFSFIGTIDSFCAKIVRENFNECGVPQNFRIADDHEMNIISDFTINKSLEKIYLSETKGKKIHEFQNINSPIIKTIEFFINEKNDEDLIEVILKLYKLTRIFPEDEDFFKICKNIYNDILNKNLENFNNSSCLKILNKEIEEKMEIILEFLEYAKKNSEEDKKTKEIYFQNISNDVEVINSFLNNKENNIKTEEKNKIFKRLSPAKNIDEILKEKIKFARDEAKKIFSGLSKYLFDFNDIKNDTEKILFIVENLYKILKIFINELELIKFKKNIVDFADLEKITLKLIKNNKLSDKFYEIMVDEYQDVNFLQDKIFNFLSKNKKNLFIVGDLKQSIYGFRLASPKIFTNYLKECDNNSSYNKIILDKNFRSQKSIIDEVNYTFENLMNPYSSEIDYTNGHKLIHTKNNDKNNNFLVNIINIDENSINKFNGKVEDVNDYIESKFITSYINQTVNSKKYINNDGINRYIKYSDFCILIRSANKKISSYIEALSKNKTPVQSQTSFNFFETDEIEILFSILKVMDSPDDISILSILMSPIFGFNYDDIIKIKINNNKNTFYSCIKQKSFEYNKSSDDKLNCKCYKFIKKINNYLELSYTYSIEKLIEYVIEDCSLKTIICSMDNHESRILNIKKFIEIAKKYSENNSRGFSSFVSYLIKLKEKKIIFYNSNNDNSDDFVKIMSIHKSKGLEFPICIIAGCSNNFLKEHGQIIMNQYLGIGIKLKNEDGTLKFQNAIRKSCEILIKKEDLSEKIRLLYVAMTRAKEKLIFTISLKKAYKKIENIIKYHNLLKKCKNYNLSLNYYLKKTSSFSEWIIYILVKKLDPKNLEDFINKSKSEEYKNNVNFFEYNEVENMDIINIEKNNKVLKTQNLYNENQKNDENIENFKKKIVNRFDFIYKNSDEIKVLLKTNASEISHSNNLLKYISVPSFVKNSVDIGNAIHEFLYFSDFKNAKENYDKNLLYLHKNNFLKVNYFKILNKNYIKNYVISFLNSKLSDRIIKSKKIFKEYQFTILKKIYQNSNSKTLIQGAIDCVFEEKDGFVIVDYKSDNVNKIEELVDNYINQLQIYKIAFEKCENKNVKELIIYSFKLKKYISLKKEMIL